MKKNVLYFLIVLFTINNSYSQGFGRIEEKTLQCVVNIDGRGSGFLVEDTQKNPGKVFLVTNKHMIGDWNIIDALIPNQTIVISLYSTDKKSPIIPVKIPISDSSNKLLPSVNIHPNQKIDIVVVDVTEQVNNKKGVFLSRFDISYLVPIDSIGKKTYTGTGDEVFAIGYPAGITSKSTNLPIVKTGVISSSLSGDLVVYSDWLDRKKNKHKVTAEGNFFLVDGLIIGGNSGGPVVHAKERKFRVNDGVLQYTQEEIPNLIFGIVSYGIGNTGVSVVYSCDHILELLKNFEKTGANRVDGR